MAKAEKGAQQSVSLNAFVKEAILESLRAIKSAQEDEDVGSLVSPSIASNAKIDPAYGVACHDGRMFTTMTFDLAVTAETTEKEAAEAGASGGAGFLPFALKLGVSSEGARKNENVNRLKFAVHVELPTNNA